MDIAFLIQLQTLIRGVGLHCSYSLSCGQLSKFSKSAAYLGSNYLDSEITCPLINSKPFLDSPNQIQIFLSISTVSAPFKLKLDILECPLLKSHVCSSNNNVCMFQRKSFTVSGQLWTAVDCRLENLGPWTLQRCPLKAYSTTVDRTR